MTTPPPSRNAAEKGFTLVELLVAMLLLSLLGVVLAGAFQMASTHAGRYSERLERSARLAAAQNFLRSRLAAAEPAIPVTWDGRPILFRGRKDALEFVGPAPQSLPAGGSQIYRITADRRGLTVRWIPYDGLPPTGKGRDTVLLSPIGLVAFSYFGARTEDGSPQWHESWDDADKLPLLVRIDMAAADGSALPAVIAAPRAAIP